MNILRLESTIQALTFSGKGILAADESLGTIKKRFDSINVVSTEETRRAYRELLITTPQLEKYISGIILFEETLFQKDSTGIPFVEILEKKGIVPGIKVDKGRVALANFQNDKITEGLDGLMDRFNHYKQQGARFAKWRAVFSVSPPSSRVSIKTDADALARYAAICQNQEIVPIVEPEVLMDGPHSIEDCAAMSEQIFHLVFDALHRHHVLLEYIILKPNMILPGKDSTEKVSVENVAERTIQILKRTVPAAVPSINFLSGGQEAQPATAHLNAINQKGPHPWYMSFSYGRALQSPALEVWRGHPENVVLAQQELLTRAQLNSAATQGRYSPDLEPSS